MTRTIIVLLFLFHCGSAICQTISQKVRPVLTADSLKSGNAKDVLTSFFQLAFNRFTGKDKEVAFNSNPFAILLKSDPSLAIDRNYYKYRALRKTNFGFAVRLDTSYRFNGFSSGIKYALIDKRDTSTSKMLFENLMMDSLNKEVDQIQLQIVRHAIGIADKEAKKKFVAESNRFLNDEVPYNKLSDEIRKVVRNIVEADTADYPLLWNLIDKEPNRNVSSLQKSRYEKYKSEVKKGLLWTIGLSDTTYKDQFLFSNVLFNTELVKGIGKKEAGSNWEFNIKAGVNFIDDTLIKGRDLKRTLLNFEPGFNWVVRNARNDQSFLEIKFSGSYYHNFNRLYANERRDSITMNAALRVRIISDIWIPLEIKYDPKTGNVFGFLNVRVNFKALGKLTKDLM